MGKKRPGHGEKVQFFPQMFLKSGKQARGEEEKNNSQRNKADTEKANRFSQF